MRFWVLILVSLTWTGCATIHHVPSTYVEGPNTADLHISMAVGKEKNGQRILIGLGLGAVLGAVAGAAVAQEMNEEAFRQSDDSRTDTWKVAAVGSVVGAGVGAIVAAVTTKRAERRYPPRIPDRIRRYLTTTARPVGAGGVSFIATGLRSGFHRYRLQSVDYVEAKRIVVEN